MMDNCVIFHVVIDYSRLVSNLGILLMMILLNNVVNINSFMLSALFFKYIDIS